MRGLVLEGGGGKGAYAFGCLLAFAERGLRFDAVSGASAGALNAALWSAGKLSEGKTLYKQLTLVTLIAHRRHQWALLPLAVLLAGLNLIPYHLSRTVYPPRLITIATNLFLALVTIIVIIFLRDSNHLLFLLIVAVGLGILLVSLTLPYLLRTFEFSLLRSTPLREAIAAGIASAPFQVPTYCTLARRVDIADPGETRGAPTVEQFIRSGGYPLSEDRIAELIASLPMLPAPRRVTVPEYFRIDKAADDLRIRVLLGSAALPYGLFPEARPDGTWSYFDGGVADNTPLYPLIADCPCNELVIVYLRPLKGTQESRIAAHMDRCRALDRLLRLGDIPATLKREILYRMWKGQPNVSVPVVDCPFWPERIIEVAPKQSLGTFFTGTLNIRWKKAKELIRAGYEDAQEVIHTNWPGLHSGAPLWP